MTTTPQQAHNLVLGAVVTTGVLGVVRDVSHGQAPTIREGLGLTVAGVMLALLIGPSPALAGGLAALMTVTALLTIGADAFGALNKGLSA